jgi:uncharacterized hydrophobic protein (TIGR00271 family)
VALVHLRVLCPQELAGSVVEVLSTTAGVFAISSAGVGEHAPDLHAVNADLARECADYVLTALHELGVPGRGMIAMDPIETAIGTLARKAEDDAPGEADDALIWGELLTRTGSESTFSWTFLAFMVLATLLAAIGVVTDSQITIVGAMVIGPEFGPLAGLAVGLVRRREQIAKRAAIALLIGFPAAIIVTAVLTLLARATGLVSPSDLAGHRATDFIYHPGWFSLITALVAGTAGMLSLTSSKSAALVGVFISVTTIPAAGNAGVAGVLGEWNETWQSMAQLGINLVGIVAAGTLTLVLRGGVRARAS